MTTMERRPSDDQRQSHDDPLLDGLLILCNLHDCSASRASLTAGLPLPEQRLSADLLPRAAARAGLQGRVLRRTLEAISPLNLPVLLLLKDGRSAVLRKIGPKNQLLILPCEADGGEQWVNREHLDIEYSGQAFFAKPQHELEEARTPLVPRVEAWFRDTLKLSRWLYTDAVLASLLINLLGLMVPLFVMQTYDRVVPNQATATLWVLAIGLFIGTAFELLLRVLRAYLLDVAGKKTDVVLSATLFERITGMSMSSRPATIGGFAQSIHDFQGLREFLTAVTLTSLIDLPFSLLMIVVIGLLGGWLVIIPLLAFPITAIFALIIQARLRDTVQKSLALGAERQALLIETLGGLETLKACSAESERQHRWEKTHGALTRLDSHARFLAALATNGTMFLQQFAGMATIVSGVYIIIAGHLSVGALVASYMLGSRVLAPLGQIAGLITRYQQAQLTMTSTDALMALPQERQANQRPLERTHLKGALDVRQVSFSYPGQEHPGAAADELLHAERRPDSARQPRPASAGRCRPAPSDRLRGPRPAPAVRQPARQPHAGRTLCQRLAHAGGGRADRRDRAGSATPTGLRSPGRRARPVALRRPAPGCSAGPRTAARPAHSAAGRAHQRHGQHQRGHPAQPPAELVPGQDAAADHPSLLDAQPGRPPDRAGLRPCGSRWPQGSGDRRPATRTCRPGGRVAEVSHGASPIPA